MRRQNIKPLVFFFIMFFLARPVYAAAGAYNFFESYIFLALVLLLGFIGLIIELFTERFGLGLLVSIFSFMAFFLLNSKNLDGNLYFYYFILGITLLIVEIIIPGFTITGVLGILFIALSVIKSVSSPLYGLLMFLAVMLISIGILAHLFRRGYSSSLLDKLILKKTYPVKESKGKEENLKKRYIGKRATVITDMRPSGTIILDGEKLDAISEGVYIKKGLEVEVIEVEGNKIIVRRV